VELDDDYLSRQLIAYIGNKRSLLPFLARVFTRLTDATETVTFLDPFCGSGSVSRLGKYLGYRVLANDWEPYARIVTECHVAVDKNELEGLFLSRGGAAAVFEAINTAGSNNRDPGYITCHYAPSRTDSADYRYERLFYTRENALFIDGARDLIEEWFPREGREKIILLSSLLYQAATHANTSGVFKAYHKGFGGHGKDALKRIMQPMKLEIPLVINSGGDFKCEACSMDAVKFVEGRSCLLCYLDPPYNNHQYGSNYFMLNSIALWDKPEISMARGEDNRLREKAGIRKDWVKTRSSYCSKYTAGDSFRKLLDMIDARYICLSYNTEGIIPFEELCDTMASQGKLTLQSEDYVKYRGGKQSISRNTHNIEFLLVLDRKKTTADGDRKTAVKFFAIKKIHTLLKRSFVPGRIKEQFMKKEGSLILVAKDGQEITASMRDNFRFETMPSYEELTRVDLADLTVLEEKLIYCLCRDRKEECDVLVEVLKTELPPYRRKTLQRLLVQVVRKFSHKKYRKEFFQVWDELSNLASADPERFGAMKPHLEEIRRIALLRFSG